MSTRGRKPGLLFKVAVLGISLFLSLVAVEAGLWLMGKEIPVVWVPDKQVGWRNLPGAHLHYVKEGDGIVDINSLGNRDRERTAEKSPGVFRVAVFGDSMTEAVEVNLDKTFCYLLEERLSRPDAKVEVLNFGVIGYSPIQELLLFREEGPRYKPDLVILALFVDNDVSGCRGDLAVVDGAPLVSMAGNELRFDYSACYREYDSYMREPVHLLRAHSRLYHVLNDFRIAMKNRRALGQDANSIPKRFMLYHDPLPPVWEDAWKLFERVLLEFKLEAEKQGVPLVVVSVPAAQVVSAESWQDILKTYPKMAGENWRLLEPEDRLLSIIERQGIVFFRPLETFQKASSGSPLFFGNAGHMTTRGHEVMTAALAEFLLRNKLVPQ
ncbi:MAG: SGNH/GDSL hydrolase family protein [Planctomycetota bacterium]